MILFDRNDVYCSFEVQFDKLASILSTAKPAVPLTIKLFNKVV